MRSTRRFLGAVRAVLFAPEDLALVRGDPSERRRFLDELASIRRPRIAGVRADYDKVLRQRTALLKSATAARLRGRPWRDGHPRCVGWASATHGAQLIAARLELVNQLAPEVEKGYQDLAPTLRPAAIVYRSAVPTANLDPETLEQELLTELGRHRQTELDRGCVLSDLIETIWSCDWATSPPKASQVMANRGRWRLLCVWPPTDCCGAREELVLILDDVFAELRHLPTPGTYVGGGDAEQVLVTAAVDDDIPTEWRP